MFTTLILPHLVNDTRTHWDNFASGYTLTANSTTGFPPDFRHVNSTVFKNAFKTPSDCQAACLSFDECLSWRHDSGSVTCALDRVIALGREIDSWPGRAAKPEIVSGWILERMESRLKFD